jgi:hypothetical protein
MDFHIVKMYKDKWSKTNVKNILLSMCDVGGIWWKDVGYFCPEKSGKFNCLHQDFCILEPIRLLYIRCDEI